MSFLQFPKQQYYRVLNTDTVTKLGSFLLEDGTEIKNMVVWGFVRGVIPSPFNFRINIYGNNVNTTPLFSSDWAILSASTLINNTTGLAYVNNWIGYFYVDFGGKSLNPNSTYYISVETSGYTRVADSFYFGINLDWYSPTNTQLDAPDEAGMRLAILGDRA
jgi:hypothetical protein